MALLRTEADWKTFLQSAGIQDDATLTTYAGLFVTNGFNEVILGESKNSIIIFIGRSLIFPIQIIEFPKFKFFESNISFPRDFFYRNFHLLF